MGYARYSQANEPIPQRAAAMGDLISKCQRRHSVLCPLIVLLPVMVTVLLREPLNWPSQASRERSTQQAEQNNLRFLESAKPFDCELSSGQACSVEISLKAGQCLRVLVDHWGVDIDVTWYRPSGQKITELTCRRSEPTSVTLIAEVSGTYHIELQAPQKHPGHGRCRVTIEELRLATATDKKRVLAEQAAAEAERLRWEWKEVSSKRAIQKYEEALGLWRSAGERGEQSVALRYIGQVHLGLGKSREALGYFHQALPIAQALRDLRKEGAILNDLGSAYGQLGENQQAFDYLNRALALSQRASNRRMEAQAHNNLGEVYCFSGDPSKSIGLYQKALSLWRELGDLRGQALALQSLGTPYRLLSEYPQAIESFNRALDLWRVVDDRRGQALTLLGLGQVYSSMGENQAALNLFGQAKPLIESMGDRYWESGLVGGLAYCTR